MGRPVNCEVDRKNVDSDQKNVLQCGLCFLIVDSLQQLGPLDPSVRNYEPTVSYCGHLQCNLVWDRAHERFDKSFPMK